MSEEIYDPCHDGLHVCAISWRAPRDPQFVTLANVPGVTEALFAELEQSYAIPEDEDPDLVVDLIVDDDIIRDFHLRHQDLVALLGTAKLSVEAAPRPEADQAVRTQT